MAEPYDVPAHLEREILRGRCVAFVGAGLSANAPRWRDMLLGLADRLSESGVAANGVAVRRTVFSLMKADPAGTAEAATKAAAGNPPRVSGLTYQAAGQLIVDAFGRKKAGREAFERSVRMAPEKRSSRSTCWMETRPPPPPAADRGRGPQSSPPLDTLTRMLRPLRVQSASRL